MEPIDLSQKPFVGIGKLSRSTSDARAGQVEAARMTVRVLRRYSQLHAPETSPSIVDELLQRALRLHTPAGKRRQLQLYVFPAPPYMETEPDWIAAIFTSTSEYRRGQQPLLTATDLLVDRFLAKLNLSMDEVDIWSQQEERASWPRLFSYSVFVTTSTSGVARIDMESSGWTRRNEKAVQ